MYQFVKIYSSWVWHPEGHDDHEQHVVYPPRWAGMGEPRRLPARALAGWKWPVRVPAEWLPAILRGPPLLYWGVIRQAGAAHAHHHASAEIYSRTTAGEKDWPWANRRSKLVYVPYKRSHVNRSSALVLCYAQICIARGRFPMSLWFLVINFVCSEILV